MASGGGGAEDERPKQLRSSAPGRMSRLMAVFLLQQLLSRRESQPGFVILVISTFLVYINILDSW